MSILVVIVVRADYLRSMIQLRQIHGNVNMIRKSIGVLLLRVNEVEK